MRREQAAGIGNCCLITSRGQVRKYTIRQHKPSLNAATAKGLMTRLRERDLDPTYMYLLSYPMGQLATAMAAG